MDKKNSFYVVGFTTLICFLFGLGVSVVYNSTKGMLKNNEALHKNRVLSSAFMLQIEDNPESYEIEIKDKLEVREFTDDSKSRQFYKLIKSKNKFVGFNFSGMGFWDRIDGIIVLNQDLTKIINIKFLEQKETPGLGGRIEETWFTDQFKGLTIAWEEPLQNRILIRTASKSIKKNEFDAIAGATQTSMALKRILNNELEEIRKLVLLESLNNE